MLPSTIDIEREWYGRSLAAFCRGAWPIIEPGTTLEWNWHLDAICEFLEAVTRGEIRDGAIEMPPRLLKSRFGSVLWPAWVWATQPEMRWIFGSYAQHLALRDAVAHRSIITSPWYQERWPLALADDDNQKGYFRNVMGGHRYATSVGSGATGEGADIIVVDDPLKAQDAHSELARKEALRWWRETMPSRLNDQRTGRRLVIMQRLHEADLAGWCREQGYTMLSLANEYDPKRKCVVPEIKWKDPRRRKGELLFPARFGKAESAKLKRSMGSLSYAAQYNQDPAPDDGSAIFPTEAWRLYESLPTNADGSLRRPSKAIVSWDMSFSGKPEPGEVRREPGEPAYTVGQLWYFYGALSYLIDECRGQWQYAAAEQQIVAFHNSIMTKHPFPPSSHVVERKANGFAILSRLRKQIPGIVGFNPDPYGSKTQRAWAVQPRVEAGQVHLPKSAQWLDDWTLELRRFPNGQMKDRVDAFTQAHLVGGMQSWGVAA